MRSAANHVSQAPTGQLELRETSSRLIALLRERQKLLAKVTRKKGKLEKLLATLEAQHAQMSQLSSVVQPLLAQGQKIDREIHELFAAIFARAGLKRKDRRLIRELYEMLQLEGILSPRHSSDGDTFEFDSASDGPASDSPFPSGEFPPPPDPSGEHPSARRSAGSTATALRELFRRLATAIHPDKAQDVVSKEKRTEAMKDVTRAYHDGDLARLIELEKVWITGASPDLRDEDDESERRCSSLEQTNRELKLQLKELDTRMRDLKRSAPAEFAVAFGRRGGHAEAPLDSLVSTLETEVDALRETRAFVQSFVDGKITCDQFVAGPARAQPDDSDDELAMGIFEDFLADIMLPPGFADPVSPKRRRRRRR
jgi:hypothetical protein